MLFSEASTSVVWPNTIAAGLADNDAILWQACEVIESASHLAGSHSNSQNRWKWIVVRCGKRLKVKMEGL